MIISGKDLSLRLKNLMKEQVAGFPQKYGRVPKLAVILVGENPASQTYVRNKGLACEYTGMEHSTILMPADTTEKELLEKIRELNEDTLVDGILVQLPLPKHINEDVAINTIAKEKDVDGFHPGNVADLWLSSPRHTDGFTVPCTPRGIMRLLEAAGVNPDGKRAVVIGRSNIVGLPVAKLLLNANATVTICHSHTSDLASVCKEADILVAAIGKANFVTADMVKPGAAVIDVGINRNSEGKLCGDVDFASVEPIASVITPVPGGVGPMTICCLMENTIEAFLRKQQ